MEALTVLLMKLIICSYAFTLVVIVMIIIFQSRIFGDDKPTKIYEKIEYPQQIEVTDIKELLSYMKIQDDRLKTVEGRLLE